MLFKRNTYAIKALTILGCFMNRADLVEAVSNATNLSKKDADAAISAFLAAVTDAVADGEKVTLVGFGSFESRVRGERLGRNPQTGEAMTIPSKAVPFFSAGKPFKDRLAS